MAKTESTFINMTLALFAVTFVAALSLSAVYNVTKDPISKSKKEKFETALAKVIPAFDEIKTRKVLPDGGDKNDTIFLYDAYKGEEIIGTAIKTYTDKGFSGRFYIMVGFLPDGSIFDVAVLEHKETPGLGDKMEKKKSINPDTGLSWSDQFKNKNPKVANLTVTKDGGEIDAITAATISSRAFCDAVQKAQSAYIKEGGTN